MSNAKPIKWQDIRVGDTIEMCTVFPATDYMKAENMTVVEIHDNSKDLLPTVIFSAEGHYEMTFIPGKKNNHLFLVNRPEKKLPMLFGSIIIVSKAYGMEIDHVKMMKANNGYWMSAQAVNGSYMHSSSEIQEWIEVD